MASTPAISPLVYYHMFTPEDIRDDGDMSTSSAPIVSTTQMRIPRDHDGPEERVVRLPLMTAAQARAVLPNDEDITVVIRLGSAIVPEKRDPLYIMITDENRAVGFKISESGPIKGAEGLAGRYLQSLSLRGDDKETQALNREDWPDEFVISYKPRRFWGTIFCSQGNGTKQCVGYSNSPRFRDNGMSLDIYRHDPIEEYLLHYIEVKVFVNSS